MLVALLMQLMEQNVGSQLLFTCINNNEMSYVVVTMNGNGWL